MRSGRWFRVAADVWRSTLAAGSRLAIALILGLATALAPIAAYDMVTGFADVTVSGTWAIANGTTVGGCRAVGAAGAVELSRSPGRTSAGWLPEKQHLIRQPVRVGGGLLGNRVG